MRWLPLLLVPHLASAADTWSQVAPGIDLLHRVTSSQDYHVVLVDLSRDEIWLRATKDGENGQRTSSFAASVGATVAINGDLWDADNWSAYEPLGLAVGDGWGWRDDTWDHAFFACDPTKACWFDGWGHVEPWNPRTFNAVGGMHDLLVIDGVGQSYSPSFYAQRHPRTALGLTQDGQTLILLVADGRRPGAQGMHFADMTAVMLEFGAWNAMNADGGGSSTLVVGGSVRNVPSDGSERVVANHLAIMVAGAADAACQGRENGRYCESGTLMRTCTGGLDRGTGDCAAFGLSCEQDGDFAYCVDPRCSNGGQANVCADATRIGFCVDGVYSEGDCAGYGLPCVEGFDTAWCYADFHQATPEASSLGAPTGGTITLPPGGTADVWFELRNTGLQPFRAGVTKLAPMPRDQPSALAGPGWLAPHRAATVPADVAPGAIGRFTFTVQAGESDATLALGLVEEGVAWFADAPAGGGPVDSALTITVHVVPEDPADDDDDDAADDDDTADDDAADDDVADDDVADDDVADDDDAPQRPTAPDGAAGCGVAGRSGGRGHAALTLPAALALWTWRRRRAPTR